MEKDDMTKQKPPKVRLAKPGRRPYQLRYTCPDEKREVRISTGTHDEDEAERQKAELEAKLLLGLETRSTARKAVRGPGMSWEDFREEYSRLKVSLLPGHKSASVTEAHLDVAERIVDPRTLSDIAGPATLADLQADLLAGAESKRGPRSPHTVRSYMITVKAAINWAHEKGWLSDQAKCKGVRIRQRSKGRPVIQPEFDAMLKAVESVCKVDQEGWKFFLKGLWEGGLRLGETYGLSWDDPETIHPIRDREGTVVLYIPGTSQKNGETDTIPTTPDFAALLNTVPNEDRTGLIFDPAKQRGSGRFGDIDQAGRIISKIGKEAGVIVNSKGKAASAHDLRRGFGQRMADAGVPILELQAIMRHSDFRTTQAYYLKSDALKQSKRLAEILADCTQVHTAKEHEKRTHVEST